MNQVQNCCCEWVSVVCLQVCFFVSGSYFVLLSQLKTLNRGSPLCCPGFIVGGSSRWLVWVHWTNASVQGGAGKTLVLSISPLVQWQTSRKWVGAGSGINKAGIKLFPLSLTIVMSLCCAGTSEAGVRQSPSPSFCSLLPTCSVIGGAGGARGFSVKSVLW